MSLAMLVAGCVLAPRTVLDYSYTVSLALLRESVLLQAGIGHSRGESPTIVVGDMESYQVCVVIHSMVCLSLYIMYHSLYARACCGHLWERSAV